MVLLLGCSSTSGQTGTGQSGPETVMARSGAARAGLAGSAGEDSFVGPGVSLAGPASSPDSVRTRITVRIGAQDQLSSCDPAFRPTSTTLFNDPSGSKSAQFRLLTHLVKLVDCTPPTNLDGSQASIKVSFYSLTYAPLRRALVAAAQRGVAVQALANSHADRFQAWSDLVEELGSDTRASSFAVTCWQGCLTPRQPPVPGGPTAWFSAHAASEDSRITVFADRSRAGAVSIASWSWDFGDGTYATGPGPHVKVYRNEGFYSTSLAVRDSLGVTHSVSGNVTIPDSLEPMYPSLHSKVFLFSTVGTGRAAQRWVSAYGSGNPTYHQARAGFNNLNVSVGDRGLYRALEKYLADLVAGSRGRLLTEDYYRNISTPGNDTTGAPPTVIHLLPRASGDVQLAILRSIQCRYKLDGRSRRTKVRISMFALSRIEIGAELWRMAYERGCSVDLLYTTMTQRLRGADGSWIRDEAGADLPWGPADCLATPATTSLVRPSPRGADAQRIEVPNTVDDSAGLCAGGTLDGRVAGASAGVWIDRVSPITKGRLTVTAACPVVPYFDRMLRTWAFKCSGSQMFTHQKLMLVDGMVHGRVQKYVMTGSANWSESGLLRNDEVVTELLDAPAIHEACLKAYRHQKDVLAPTARTDRAAGQ